MPRCHHPDPHSPRCTHKHTAAHGRSTHTRAPRPGHAQSQQQTHTEHHTHHTCIKACTHIKIRSRSNQRDTRVPTPHRSLPVSFLHADVPCHLSTLPLRDSIWGRLDLIMSLTQTESHQASVAGLPFHPIRFAMESSPGGGRVAAAGVTRAWSSAALPGRNKRRASEATKAGLAVSSITALTAVFSLFVPLCIISDWIRFN